MSSVFNSLLSGGRERVGLTGLDSTGKEKTIDIDVVTAFGWTANNDVTQHPVEKDAYTQYSTISDHVIPKLPVLSMTIVLSNNLNLLSSITSFENNAISVKDKVKLMTYWQKMGSVLTLQGYTTGANAVGKILNYFKSGELSIDSKINEALYTGLSSDVIQGLVLGNITWKQTVELGIDVEANITLQKIYFATADTSKSKTNSADKAKKVDPAKSKNQSPSNKKKSILY
jgi:hypothetical protein